MELGKDGAVFRHFIERRLCTPLSGVRIKAKEVKMSWVGA